jgi:hypothetical protein
MNAKIRLKMNVPRDHPETMSHASARLSVNLRLQPVLVIQNRKLHYIIWDELLIFISLVKQNLVRNGPPLLAANAHGLPLLSPPAVNGSAILKNVIIRTPHMIVHAPCLIVRAPRIIVRAPHIIVRAPLVVTETTVTAAHLLTTTTIIRAPLVVIETTTTARHPVITGPLHAASVPPLLGIDTHHLPRSAFVLPTATPNLPLTPVPFLSHPRVGLLGVTTSRDVVRMKQEEKAAIDQT